MTTTLTAEDLVELANRTMRFFHTPNGVAFAEVDVGDHVEICSVGSRQFLMRLRSMHYRTTGSACAAGTLDGARDTLDAFAIHDCPESEVHRRVARCGETVYLDLSDAAWRVVQVSETGWAVQDSNDVRFRRSRHARSIPAPADGGNIDDLRSFVNVRSVDDFRLLITYMVHALLGQGPFPVLVWAGQKGSAKSTASLLCKTLIDPASGALRAPPRHERDLSIAAETSFLLAYDNLSSLPNWLSDALCRLSTGGAFAGRQLYTDADEHVLEFRRPVVLNGIDDLLRRADLADRAITITLDEIPSTRRLPEREVIEGFEVARPQLLGALLDLVAAALRELPSVRLDRHPRMADFARTGAAVERAAGWPDGCILRALEENRLDAVEAELGADVVAASIVRLVEGDSRGWAGTATQLLEQLADMTHPSLRHGPGWPNGARALSDRVRRLEPALRHVGIVVLYKRTNQARTIEIMRQQDEQSGEFIDA